MKLPELVVAFWLIMSGNYYNDALKESMMRAFVAVEITDWGAVESISKFQSHAGIDAKPVEPHNLHFTLQFLGEVSTVAAEKIRAVLETIEFSTFTVSFKGVGAFPKPKFPRVIWIGTDEVGRRELQELSRKVGNVLGPLGFPTTTPFKPHITVFRVKKKIEGITDKLEKFKSAEFGRQDVSLIKFKQSILTPQGPVYSDLGEVEAA